jgi:hypothetical protein
MGLKGPRPWDFPRGNASYEGFSEMAQLIDPWTITEVEAQRRADLAKRVILNRLVWIERHKRPLTEREWKQLQKLSGFKGGAY